MFWMVAFSTLLIIFFEWMPLLNEKNKDWKTIILMASLLFIGNFFTLIFYYELIELPSIADALNSIFTTLAPAFFKFMKF